MSASRSRHVVFCPYTQNTWGHVVRCLAVAGPLRARGYRATFIGGAEAKPLVGKSFVEHASIALADQAVLVGRTARARTWLRERLATARAHLRRLAPDVVVTDLQPIFNVAAALEGIPSASIANLELLPTPLDAWLSALGPLFAELGVPKWAAARTFGDTLIVADAPHPTGFRDLPPHLATAVTSSVRDVYFVGPLVESSAPRAKRRSRPRVIISLGDSGDLRLRDVLAGCKGLDADLVIVAGRSPSRATVRAAAALPHAKLVAYLPDFAAQLRSADALVTHGGHGTLLQALTLAVPTLVVPTSFERELNARRLRDVGEVTSPDPARMRSTFGAQLKLLLADRARDGARRRIARALTSYGGAKHAALAIARLAER